MCKNTPNFFIQKCTCGYLQAMMIPTLLSGFSCPSTTLIPPNACYKHKIESRYLHQSAAKKTVFSA
jgi:hypothetical protein